MNRPKRKISETVLEFGDPILGLLKEPTVEEFRARLRSFRQTHQQLTETSSGFSAR